MKRIYMVYREGGDLPKVPHDTMDEAMDEANRLADKHPGDIFHVLATTAQAKTDAPVIEVGDVVKSGHGEEGIIEYVHRLPTMADDKCLVKFPSYETVQTVWLKSLTFIRKGPKVHTFEGVEWVKCDGDTDFARPKASPYCSGDTFEKLGRRKARGKLTFTEEDTK